MPWHRKAKKDAVGCDEPRGGAEHPVIRGFLNGETQPATAGYDQVNS